MWGIPAAAAILAAHVPVSWEERLGQAAVEQLTASRRRCVDPEREAAIDAIVKLLLAPRPSVPYTFRVTVVDDQTVNAFAVPGGQVILLRGLLERTRTPEELAGVLAHELQHVLQRHATRLPEAPNRLGRHSIGYPAAIRRERQARPSRCPHLPRRRRRSAKRSGRW